MFKIGKGNQIMWLFLGLIFIVICAIIIKYTVDGFAASECKFIKLGDYNLSSDATVKAGVSSYGTKKGLIYIPTGSITFNDLQYQKPGDTNYSYISLTKTDINDIDVFIRIKSIMACHGVPEFSNTIGINSKPALILCLQSNSGTISRTFFIKCFVPKTNSTSDDSNVIVGEIAGNTKSSVYTSTVKAVSLIQSSVGTPNILPATPVTGTDYSYSLSYVICPSATRPEGFSYTDCCSAVSDSTRITPTSWTDLDITDSTKCPASATATSTTTTTIPPATKSKGCGSYPDDSSCPIPFCSLDNKLGACSGDELLRDSSTGKYLDPNCKVGSYSDYGGRLQTICTGTTNTIRNDTGSGDLDIYKLLSNRSQYHNWVEDDDSGSSDMSGDSTGKNWLNNSWFSGGKWHNNWNGDTSNIPKNSYNKNKDELLKKNKLLEERLARLEGQMILNNPTDEVCDDACES
jgi:hypothetical protein